jgi:hypothetical protein
VPDDDGVEPEAKTEPPAPDPFAPGMPPPPPPAMRVPLLGRSDRASETTGGVATGGSGVLPPGPKYGGGPMSEQGRPQYLDSLDSADIVDRISADGVFEPPGDFEG